MMDYSDLSWPQLRALAKSKDINSFGIGRDTLTELLTKAEVDPDPPKKGKPSWAPARMLDLHKKIDGFRYRWCDTDPGNLTKKQAEGWIFVNRETGHPVEHDDPNLMHGGTAPDGSLRYRDLVVMALPEELGQARDEFYQEITDNAVKQVNENAAANIEKVGPLATTRKGNLEITRITD